MSTQTLPAVDRMVFRQTNAKTGRNISVSPKNSTNQHLTYANHKTTGDFPRQPPGHVGPIGGRARRSEDQHLRHQHQRYRGQQRHPPGPE